ncbi:MAG: hypothetical protein ABIG44_06850 [Planctomycetota bacterium]
MLTISFGGCPQEQIPSQSQDQDQNEVVEPPPNNQTEQNRPIPQPPIDDDDDGTGDGGSSGGGGLPPADDGDLSQPIAIVISSPVGADINILPGQEAAINYEVFGGDPADGAIRVELFYDLDGIVSTGDEVTLMTNLPARGLQVFTANLESGVYYLGLRAANARESQTEYANGRLVLVGEPSVSLNLPAQDQRVRPNSGVQIQFNIASLATTVSYEVFTDIDTVVNGNEVTKFTGGGLSGSGTIYLENYAAGIYYIGVHLQDSTGQEKSDYFAGGDGNLRTITVDLAPAITVTEPTGDNPVEEGDLVQIVFTATDPEGAATISVFRDADGAFNGNEAEIAEFNLNTPQEDYVWAFIIPGNLPPANYRIGASITDGVGETIASYAPGSITVLGDPTVSVAVASLNPLSVRPPDTSRLLFQVNDPERKLKNQPLGIQIHIYADLENDGVPVDEDGIPTEVPVVTVGDPAFRAGLPIAYNINSSALVPELDPQTGNGHFRVAVSATERSGAAVFEFYPLPLYIDSVEPTVDLTLPLPGEKVLLEKDQMIDVAASTYDTSPANLVIRLDKDTNPENDPPTAMDPLVIVEMLVGDGPVDINTTVDLTGVPAGLYYIYVSITDGVGDPVAFYAPQDVDPSEPEDLTRIRIRDREIGDVDVVAFENPEYENGAVLKGVNSGDLAGTDFHAVPDINDDGVGEFVLSSRFGKAYNVELGDGVGFGEGYLVYGNEGRLQGAQLLSAVGGGAIPGMRFPGIRAVLTDPAQGYSRPPVPATNGLSQVTVIDDMDGDELPELVFGFPRVESVSLAVDDSRFQQPGLFPDLPSMGDLEYNAVAQGMSGPYWDRDKAQFTRGGVVIVSSHNYNLQDPQLLNRKSDRRIDLHEVGQLFGMMGRNSLQMYVRKVTPPDPPALFIDCADCEANVYDGDPPQCTSGCADCGGIENNEAETEYQSIIIAWDAWLGGG